jgi:hypothetical protein
MYICVCVGVCVYIYIYKHTHIHTQISVYSCLPNTQMANLEAMYKRREASLTSKASQYENEVAALQVQQFDVCMCVCVHLYADIITCAY